MHRRERKPTRIRTGSPTSSVLSADSDTRYPLPRAHVSRGLKVFALLRFDRDARTDAAVRANLRRLYGIVRAPCDTALRERLDEVDPRPLRAVFKRVFALLHGSIAGAMLEYDLAGTPAGGRSRACF